MTNKIKLAVQKDGRLSEKSIRLLADCGIGLANGERKLKAEALHFPLEVLYLRNADILRCVEQGVADIGIVGENELAEHASAVDQLLQLGFARCRLSLAVPRDADYTGPSYFEGRRVATSYPGILRRYFEDKGITAGIETIGGSVEVAPGIGLADGIFDIVSTGSTLAMNGLREVETVMRSQAVLIGHPGRGDVQRTLIERLIFRIKAVQAAASNKYILLNAPCSAIDAIAAILPGMKSPTILPLALDGWCSLHAVVPEDRFWEIIDKLRAAGAEGILVIPIEKMIA